MTIKPIDRRARFIEDGSDGVLKPVKKRRRRKKRKSQASVDRLPY